jgi:hypothetical protein
MVELVGTDVTDDGVAFLDGCVDLGVLKLDRTKVTAARIDKLKAGRPALWIEWSGGTLTSSLASDYRAALYAFSVGGTIRDHYTRRDHTSAEALPDRFQLTGARLRDNPKVTDTGLAVFAACSAVTDIDLSGTATGDAGLAAFRRCRALATLDLAGTRVTGAGLAALDGFADLTHVRLSGTAVDDAGLARLKDRPRLVYLDVRRTKVTAAAVREFAAARPQCKVEWDGGTVEPTR